MIMVTTIVQVSGGAEHAAINQAEATYFEKERVAEAFLKGAVLADTKDYAVNASRRDRPGIPEVHEREVDIMYMIDGRRRSSQVANSSARRPSRQARFGALTSEAGSRGSSAKVTSSYSCGYTSLV